MALHDTPGTQSGFPKYYANWDAEFWVVAPTPDSTYEITLAYVKQPISITSTTQPTTANPASNVGTYVSNKYQDLLLWMSGRSIWILERSCRYVTILHAGLSKSSSIVRDRTKGRNAETNTKMVLFVL